MNIGAGEVPHERNLGVPRHLGKNPPDVLVRRPDYLVFGAQ